MVIKGRDPGKPVPTPSTKDEMLNAFGFKQSHCDFCQQEQDPAKGMLLRMCQCKGKYFCKACSMTKGVQIHQEKCTQEKLKKNAKNAAKYADDRRSVVTTAH